MKPENPIRALNTMLSLPQDVVYEDTICKMIGNTKIRMENYRSILRYTDTEIKIQMKRGQLLIVGTHLCIASYDCDEMEIRGKIKTIVFE